MNTPPASMTPQDLRKATPAPARLLVDAPTRMFHWLFALSFAGAWLTSESEHWRALHVTLGYVFAGLLGFRLLYGLLGPRHASLGALWRRVAGAPDWLRSLRTARVFSAGHWRQGRNLSMALAIVTMLVLVAPLVLSGYATYRGWGDWLEEVHELFANAFLGMVFAHLGLIAAVSVLQRRNQALPMLTGRQPGAGPSPVRQNRAWLATLLLVATIAFGAWAWPDAGSRPSPDFEAQRPRATVGEPHRDHRPGARRQRHPGRPGEAVLA
ncbi:MAG: hypothetical protein RIS35_629 [Pseudomonadota bacterium]